MKKVLLYSGGMDSWLIDKIWKPDVRLFFHIGTKSNEVEFERVKNMKDVEIVEFDMSKFEQTDHNYFMPLRNLHFIVYAAHYGDSICIGSIGGSVHKDNDKNFQAMTEDVINYLLSEDQTREEPVTVEMPYVDMSKTELLKLYLEQGGDIEEAYKESFSCYQPVNGEECLECTSCLSKFTAFYNNGYPFNNEQIDKFVSSVEKLVEKCEPDVVNLYNELKK